MPNRIRERLVSLTNSKKLLIPFFTAGYPNIDATCKFVSAAEKAGADFVELGVPFSDPLADGPEIQYSSYNALQNGISVKKILEMVGRLRESTDLPLILMGYYNPILAYGEEKFAQDAARHGVDGLIIPDLPVEEALSFSDLAKNHNLSTIFLVSPTSSDERIRMVDEACSDFVYAVTVTGVTGTGKKFDSRTDAYLTHLRKLLKKKFVAGFGVSSPETADRLAKNADGVVIGSALVKLIRATSSVTKSATDIERFLLSIRQAI